MSIKDYFIRELDITVNGEIHVLKLYQKSEGDVNCIVWDAALVLSKYLEYQNTIRPNYLRGKKVLELGAGVGCVGLVASLFGANVYVTDLPEALGITSDNIHFNEAVIKTANGTIQTHELKWGSSVEQMFTDMDYVLLSDCVYYEESLKPLLYTLNELAHDNVHFLQCQELRDTEKQKTIWNQYIKQLQENFNFKEILLSDQHPDYTSPDIKLIQLFKQ